MLISETTLRVRYGETDKMGYVYYGYYPFYYEVARTEMLRDFGLSYRYMEDQGIMLPVHSLQVKYIKPSHYDDLLVIKTILKTLPSVKIEFDYEIYNTEKQLINTGNTVLIFVDAYTRKPRKAPEFFLDKIKPFFT